MDANTNKPNLRAIAFALAALTATVPSLAAAAGNEAQSEDVFYGDLNLGTEAGVKALDRRLDRAVERVCGGEPSIHSFRAERLVQQCREATRQSIQDEREIAIARATGHNTDGLADNSPRGQAQVTRAD